MKEESNFCKPRVYVKVGRSHPLKNESSRIGLLTWRLVFVAIGIRRTISSEHGHTVVRVTVVRAWPGEDSAGHWSFGPEREVSQVQVVTCGQAKPL